MQPRLVLLLAESDELCTPMSKCGAQAEVSHTCNDAVASLLPKEVPQVSSIKWAPFI